MQQILEIKVDVPEGYVAVDFRLPKIGDRYLSEGRVQTATMDFRNVPMVIVEEEYGWPDWIKPGTWYAEDEGGNAFLFDMKPEMQSSVWMPVNESRCVRVSAFGALADFPRPPKSSDWRKSLRQKPLS